MSVLDQLGFRASLQVVTGWNAYDRRLYDSRQRMQVGWFAWYQDYPAPSDFISPLLTCHSFLPDNPANLNAAEFCNQRIDAQAKEALALQLSAPNTAGALWTRIDHEIVGQAPWGSSTSCGSVELRPPGLACLNLHRLDNVAELPQGCRRSAYSPAVIKARTACFHPRVNQRGMAWSAALPRRKCGPHLRPPARRGRLCPAVENAFCLISGDGG